MILDGARGDQVDGCSGGLVRVVDYGLWEDRRYKVGVEGMGRVDEDYSAALVELIPDWPEGRMA